MESGKLFNIELAQCEHPFDQYQRYKDIQIVVDAIQKAQEKPVKILDVGGASITNRFLSDYEYVTINQDVNEAPLIQGDGSKLPFSDNSFDIVVSVDTLEHLPEEKRRLFINELMRVADAHVIITCPFANGYNEFSEIIFNNYLIDNFNINHRFLQEHIQNGLPDLDMCLRWVTQTGAEAIAIPSGYVNHWLPLLITHEMLHSLVNGSEIAKVLNVIYNHQNYWADHKMPGYRQILIIAKNGKRALLNGIAEIFNDGLESQNADFQAALSLWQTLEWAKAIRERDVEIQRLKALVEGYRSGKVMRFLVAVQQFFKMVSVKV